MTISSTTNRVSYTGNGVTTAFAFGYKFLVNADLKVYQNGTLKTITTHYTISGAGNDNGGTVTFVSAPANNDEIVILRDPALTQGTDFVENDPLPAETLEDSLDKLTMIAQRIDDRLDRSLVLADSDPSATLELPLVADRASKYLSFDASGNIECVNTVADVTAVALITTQIGTLSAVTGQISALALVTTDMGVLSPISADIDALGGYASQIGTLALVTTQIGTLSPYAAQIDSLASHTAQIDALALQTTQIDQLALVTTQIGALAPVTSQVSALALVTTQLAALSTTEIHALYLITTEIDALSLVTTEMVALYADLPAISAKVSKTGDTMSGDLTMGVGAAINMEGATDNTYETTLTVVDPTADRTITFPDADSKMPIASYHLTFSGPTAARTYTLPDSASTLAALATLQTYTASQRGTVTTDNDGSFDMNVTNNFSWTPTGADTLEFTNETSGQSGYIYLNNGSAYAITLGTEIKAPTGTATALSAAGTYLISYFCYDGTNVAISYVKVA